MAAKDWKHEINDSPERKAQEEIAEKRKAKIKLKERIDAAKHKLVIDKLNGELNSDLKEMLECSALDYELNNLIR